jgi:dolichol-phosphate mannosyltransferase
MFTDNIFTNNLALSVIVPTRNEAGNVEILLARLRNVFKDIAIEVIFADDSTDETPQVIEAAKKYFPSLNINLIHRSAEQRVGGLGGAVMAGLNAVRAKYACVMDGDLQHPPELVPTLLKTAIQKRADLVLATRRAEKSEVKGLNIARNLISLGLDLIGRVFFPRELSGVSDPLTGFFLVRMEALNLKVFRPTGFKILMEILVRNPGLRKAEVPFNFGERFSGQSKASVMEVWKYFKLLWNLRFNQDFLRFLGFALVGVSGLLVNSLALYVATDVLHIFYLLSVGISTVISTLWNFVLMEAWIYRSSTQSAGRARRLGLFFVMNTVALSMRAPIVYILTSLVDIHYVISNLLSLALLTLLRFQFADSIIWKSTPSTSSDKKPIFTPWRNTMKSIYSYNIHDIVTVVSEGELPELEPFEVKMKIEQPTIYVQIGTPRKKNPEEGKEHYIRYSELFGPLGFEVGIEMGDPVMVVASPLLRFSPHVLYTNIIEPLLRWTFVKKGYALVHGAAIAIGDEAYMISARTDTGKTTTLLKILTYQRRNADQVTFLSDDMIIVSPDGMVMTYPKPLTVSYHTLRAIDSRTLNFSERMALPFQSRIHSRSGRHFALFISKTHLPAATINMLTQMIIPPPKYFVNKLVPKAKLTRKAHLTRMFIIERGEESIKSIGNAEAMEVLLQNCEDAYGFPPYENLKEFLFINDDKTDLREKEEAIIRQAVGKLPATVIRSNTFDWWSRIPTFSNNEQISSDIARALEVETAQDRFNRGSKPVSA